MAVLARVALERFLQLDSSRPPALRFVYLDFSTLLSRSVCLVPIKVLSYVAFNLFVEKARQISLEFTIIN